MGRIYAHSYRMRLAKCPPQEHRAPKQNVCKTNRIQIEFWKRILSPPPSKIEAHNLTTDVDHRRHDKENRNHLPLPIHIHDYHSEGSKRQT